ncbi:MAG: exonuclease SbcCD subunit D [Promethearchaeota archaeon]
MVKLVHLADTHLGYRARRGVINKWAIPNYSKPYEQEIYDTFLKVIDDISKIEKLDFLVHCGDIFHIPSNLNPFPPPEPARRTLVKAFENFFKNTKNQVPIIYIEGNHGIFKGYEYTPFESHINKERFPNLYYFKSEHLIDSIKSKTPLKIEFPEKRTRFYLFPYFEFKTFETYASAYNDWVEFQHPEKNDDYINIAVAHGSLLDDTLHQRVNSDDFEYDYVALGHEHGLREISKNHFYSGGLLPLNFKEIYENQGYLIVDIDDKTKNLKIERVFTDKLLKRVFSEIPININPKQSKLDLEGLIYNEINNFSNDRGFNPKTSARLKFDFRGEITFEKNWQINELMAKIRRECFSQPEKYNIMQIIWRISDISEDIEEDISAGIIQDYILEEPEIEFRIYVEEKLNEDKSQFDIDKLTKFGMNAIRNALKIMEKEKEV